MSAIYQLGLVHYLDSDYSISTQLLERIPPNVPEYPMARFMIGMNAYHIDDYARAAAIFSTLGPDYDILLNLGASLAAGGDLTVTNAAVVARAASAGGTYQLRWFRFDNTTAMRTPVGEPQTVSAPAGRAPGATAR